LNGSTSTSVIRPFVNKKNIMMDPCFELFNYGQSLLNKINIITYFKNLTVELYIL